MSWCGILRYLNLHQKFGLSDKELALRPLEYLLGGRGILTNRFGT
jgi:hypothetical protein